MADNNSLDFSSVQAVLTSESVVAHGAEIHGMLTGLICAGFEFESLDYLALANDMINNGEGFPTSVKAMLKELYSNIWQNLLDDSFSFQLLLPDDDDSMAERGHALSAWVQGFNLGFGLQQQKDSEFSEDVQDVLKDFAEIANLSDEMEEDEDNEQAYFEINEYVRVSALLCFAELGSPPTKEDKQATIH